MGTYRHNYRLLLFAIVAAFALIFVSAANVMAQPAPLFLTTPVADMSQDQLNTVTSMRQRPTTAAVQLVRLNNAALQSDQLLISLPGVGDEQVSKRNIIARSATDYTWIGDIGSNGGQAMIVVKDGEITGSIQSVKYLYSIVPLGGGVHALVKVDQSKYPPDHPPGSGMLNRTPANAPPAAGAPKIVIPQQTLNDIVARKRAAAGGDIGAPPVAVQVDVLVAWTATSRVAYGASMPALAQAAVDDANLAYNNSNANISMRLVWTMETAYSDVGQTFDTVLAALATGSDPNMVAIRTARDAHGADLVALMINLTDYCGLADAILADATTAYATVYWSCAVGNHSFAHELGHLFGARHDTFVDPTTTPFAYGHGYIEPGLTWRTVMAYVNGCSAQNCPRLGYFSNPSNLYGGIPMGTTTVNDNARVHRTTGATIAAFRGGSTGPANDNFANAINLPSTSSGSTTGTNVGATKEAGEPSHAGNAGGASVWWNWTAPASGSYQISLAGSSFDTLLAVYTGSSVSGLTQIAANDDFVGLQSLVTFNAVGGTTYRIAVDGFGGATGSIALAWQSAGHAIMDFNGDGKSDILWRDSSNGNLVVSLMNGAAISSSAFAANLPLAWSVIGTADFNGDGKSDILWRDTSGNVVVSLMNGSTITSSTLVATVPLSWTVVGLGDFDGDGKADILWRDFSNGNLVASKMNGASIVSSTFIATLPVSWAVVGVGDFNGDGKADILWRDNNNGNLVVSLMNGASISSSTFVANLPLTWSVAGVRDFNGDGKADILWRDTSGNVVVSLMNGASITSSTFAANLPTSWTVAAVGDYNGDGKNDILWRDTLGNVVVSLMNGPSITSSTLVATVPTTWAVQGVNANY